MSVAPSAPHTPAAAPHHRSCAIGVPRMKGIPTSSTARAPSPENAVTSGAGPRFAATPPTKSPAPNSTEESAPMRNAGFMRCSVVVGREAAPALAGARGAALGLELLEVREQRALGVAPQLRRGVPVGARHQRIERLGRFAERRQHQRLALAPVGDQPLDAAPRSALRRAVPREQRLDLLV